MARPQKSGGDNRGTIFRVRLTAAEKKLLLELSAQAGLTPSDFCRIRTIGGQPHTRKATPERAALIRLQAELNKVGNNANQIARALNRRADSDSLTGISPELVNHVLHSITLLTAQIAQELGHGHSGQ